MPFDPWALDSSGGTPAYSGQELRLGTLTPLLNGGGSTLNVRSGVRLSGSGVDLMVEAQATPNMSVLVHTGVAVVQGAITTAQGAYSYALDTVTTLSIAASHATLDRTDLICIRIRDASVDTSGARDGAVVVVQGTNGAGVPAVPTNATYLVLAQVFVLHAVTSITNSAITDKRPFLAALGGATPVPSSAAEVALGTLDGTGAFRTDIHVPRYYHGGVSAFASPGAVLLSRQVLGSDAASVTFSSIPGDFTHLQIRMKVRTSNTGNTSITLRFNGDSGANYDWCALVWNNSTAPGTAHAGSNGLTTSVQASPVMADAGLAANQYSNHVIEVADYSDAAASGIVKTVYAFNSRFQFPACFGFGGWYPASAAAVTSLTLTPGAGNFKAASSFSLYGLS